jgi:DNA-binding transcriptional MerR regulator/methylmalonyl-CoA mutase cobalamin-binding subunit
MYTIKQAASRAGVSVPVLRQWERRYGVVHPSRTPSGYPTYDEPAIARLRAMRRLIDEGWAPSAAAGAVKDLDEVAVAQVLARGAERADAPDPRRTIEGDLLDAFRRAAADLDMASLEHVLDEMFARGSFELVAERYLLPALRAVGQAWEAGQLDVAAEHAASHAVLRRLAVAYQASIRPLPGPGSVLVGLPPGSRHELGALVFSVAARRAGLRVIHLGADLPVADWLDAAAQADASAAVVGAVSSADVPAAAAVLEALSAARPGMLLAIGGRAAAQVAGPAGTLPLPEGVNAAVDAVREGLGLAGGGRATGQP